jgi:hypothetical protein
MLSALWGGLMRRTAFTTLVTGVLVLVPSVAQAAVVAAWQMDEPSEAKIMNDSAGANNGTIFNVQTGVPGLVGGKAYRFGGTTSYVQVPDDNSLDPGSANITLTASVRADNKPMPDDSYDLVRKGVTTTAGGEWKMEIKRKTDPSVGFLSCVFKGVVDGGRVVTVIRNANVDVVDGRTHTLKCQKTAKSVAAVVDGKVFTTSGAAGSIANNQPVIVGAKSSGDDVLQGVLDRVTVAIG